MRPAKALFSALILALSAQTAAAELPPVERIGLSLDAATANRAWKKAHRALLDDLGDPDSAKFRCVTVKRSKTEDLIIVNGGINAKNAYGGYVGYKAFTIVMLPDLNIRNGSILSVEDSTVCENDTN